MKEYTREELSLCTGEDGQPALIACNGVVYDVSHSYYWSGGRHHVLHRAGTDLTAELQQAPRGAQLLESVWVVGTLRESRETERAASRLPTALEAPPTGASSGHRLGLGASQGTAFRRAGDAGMTLASPHSVERLIFRSFGQHRPKTCLAHCRG